MAAVKFNKHHVTNGATKARVFYSASQNLRNGALIPSVTIYAKDYGRALGAIFPGQYENATDLQSDYFDEGHVRFFPGDEHYAAALARAQANAADWDRRHGIAQ